MQELEKILYELEKRIFTAEVYNDDFDGTTITNLICLGDVRDILEKHMNDGWIPVEDGLPEDGTDVLVVLKPTYESDYIEYSIARYLRFENDEAHWCDNHYGYLEWEKYSDGRGGSSQYKVIAWQSIAPYRPERSEGE